jgi:tRNA uridine 5-carboxymethylaminomethyl modification enzyme
MFTSRAEYRLILREDNADLRLTEMGRKLGLIKEEQWEAFSLKREAIEQEKQRLSSIVVHPNTIAGDAIQGLVGKSLEREYKAIELLRRPELNYFQLTQVQGIGSPVIDNKVAEQVEIQTKYAGYVERQHVEIERQRRHEETTIPIHFDYDQVIGLSNEVRQKLSDIKPVSVGHASRIPGITPAAVSLLLVHLKKRSG